MTEETPHRPHSHVVGDVGQTEVALVFKRWGWTADEIASDYGEDLDCNIFVNQRRTELHFRCQVKSTTKDSQYIRFLKAGNISVSIETSLASFWLTSYYPVLLIIYIDDTREIYWENATQYLRKNLDKLTKKRISIHVNKNNLITQSQANIEKNIQEFYAQILRLSSPQLVCKIIPVLMPEYKILEFEELYKFELASRVPGLHIDTRGLIPDYLPSWTTILSSINSTCFYSWIVAIKDVDIESFDNKIITFLESVGNEYKSSLSNGEWLSFICSPLRILDSDNNSDKTFNLNQEMTGWWSYCYINQRIASDVSYAFDLPKDCLMPLPYNGFSWRFDHFVDPVTDLAIEFLGVVPALPSYVAGQELKKSKILSQVLPWKCSLQEVDLLDKMLDSLGIVFTEIPSLSEEEVIVGAIHDRIFSPTLGWVPEPRNWKELENGSILEKLNEVVMVDKLPGRYEDMGVTDFILKFFKINVAQNLIINEREYIPGIPIKHSTRSISVQRLRIVKTFNEKEIIQRLCVLKNYLESNLDKHEDVNISSYSFRNLDDTLICVLSVSWIPNLYETSLESLERFSDFICQAFNEAVLEIDCEGECAKNIGEILQLGGVELKEF